MKEYAKRVEFTKRMKKDYTILAPNMSPIHFELLQHLLCGYGYNLEILSYGGQEIVDEGLKYVHNDTCYPALLVIGQMIHALKTGKYDLNKTALMITQTGGGCRASNYLCLLRKALKKAGLSHIPVVSVSIPTMEKNSGFKITFPMLFKVIKLFYYGDLLMLLSNQTIPYEVEKGESERLIHYWTKQLVEQLCKNRGYSKKEYRQNVRNIISSFEKIRVVITDKIKVGIVGEIYVKYSEFANNNLNKFLIEQGCEIMVPGLMGFILYVVDNHTDDYELYGGNWLKYKLMKALSNFLLGMEATIIEELSSNARFRPPLPYKEMKRNVSGIISHGSKMGEGWLLTAEMVELIEHGFENIVCAQPFGCLPNHIVGKGMIRKLKMLHNNANIVPIDYDPGATKVNQENRIKLMLSIARERLDSGGTKAKFDNNYIDESRDKLLLGI